ncbi:hypothetical protein niasHT_024110 [Heterodera trifolii]|uniref:Glycosyltransferase family 92 protein n=1 Tax=Heterodera trifolii TaxID=157864 RepID=A0ABD2KQQ0_9BILA
MHHQIHRQQRQNGTNEAANLCINAVQANEGLRLNGTNETAAILLINAVKENDTAPLAPPAQPAKAMHFVVISAVYSTKSKLYSDNQIVLLVDAQFDDAIEQQIFVAKTSNGTNEQQTNFTLHKASGRAGVCLWSSYISVFDSVDQPIILQIGQAKNMAQIEVKRSYDKKRFEVGTCFSPLFFAEHWQLVVLTIEIYRHFGSALQIIYLMSAIEGIFDILKLYQEADVVQIEHWYSIQIEGEKYKGLAQTINTNQDWRNQISAHTDCLIKYGNAAEFLIIGDIDDVLVPNHGFYYDEFIRNDLQNAAALLYDRFYVDTTTTRDPERFSLLNIVMSAKVDLQESHVSKYVVNTSLTESLWVHWPANTKPNTTLRTVPAMDGRMFHLRRWHFVEDEEVSEFNRSTVELDELRPTEAYMSIKLKADDPLAGVWWNTYINEKNAKRISERFNKNILRKHPEIFRKIPMQMFYGRQFSNCYLKFKIAVGAGKLMECPGPHHCEIQPIAGLNCTISKRIFVPHTLSYGVTLYVAPNEGIFQLSTTGCTF